MLKNVEKIILERGLYMGLSEQAKKQRREYMKKWREKNREHVLKYQREYMKDWRKENKERIDQYNENYWNKKAAELERGEKIVSNS